MYMEMSDYKKAKESTEKMLIVRAKSNGENHPNTLEAKGILAHILDKLGESEQSLQLCNEILDAEADLTLETSYRVLDILKRHGQIEEPPSLVEVLP